MDLSALIFVALAVAWAVYLIPKALRHHDEDARSRTVDAFSHTMRVLARREPINRRSARLVVTPGRPASTVREAASEAGTPEGDAPPALTPALAHASRRAAARAAKRRLRVLCLILVGLLTVVALAAFSVIGWVWVWVPVGVMVAWLVACRLMVRKERAVRRPSAATPTSSATPAPLGGAAAHLSADLRTAPAEPDAAAEAEPTSGPITEEIAPVEEPAAAAASADPALWDPVPVTLPTYVTKPAATRRTVRTIDLDDTGVWTSGRTQADSQIARDADEAERADKAATATRDGDHGRRASGS